jgi:PAS domain S-box-containing protein
MSEPDRSQLNLLESKLLFSSVFEQFAVGLAYLDSAGYYQMVNQKFCDIVGYSRAELLTKSFVEITHPEDLPRGLQLTEQLFTNQISTFELEKRYIRKDGTWTWAELHVSVLRSPAGQPKWLLAAISDINDRKRAEAAQRHRDQEALRLARQSLEVEVQARTQELDRSKLNLQQQEEQFQRIFEHAPIAIALTDLPRLRYLKVNQAMCDMVGYSAQELGQKTVADITHPEDIQTDLETFKTLLNGEVSQFCLEKRYICKNGEILWGSLTVTLIHDPDGTPLYNLGMIVDITERKRAEAILKASEEQLRISLQEKEVLLKEVHHRVKNNMQVVSSLLSLQSRAIDDPKVLAPLKEIQQRIKVMSMVHERFYQSENLAQINFPEYVQSLIQDVICSYSPASLKTDLNLHIANIDLGIDTVIPCGLILHELVSNVIKHAFPDPGDHKIGIYFTANAARHCVLTVTDNGVGLPEAIQPDRVESLGLQIVSALTMKLRGTMECDRHHGTTFHIKFTC